MAKTDLRAYYDEIESLISRGRYDEAVAHCRHILQVFPKSVQTYRLLGKAFLEARRYTDAVDIFQRVLSALPSDFVSHLGLSIIREDEGNLDAAIWHMERAFEIQPYNGAIQEELRRLFGRRDGSSPPKIRLTRAALARMYAKGNLYQQAAAESRNILKSEPQRLDIQLLLAEMYYKSGKSVEAAEISSKVLNKLPFSLEGNRILVRILENSEHREEHSQYKDRLSTLDPYESSTSAEVNDVSLVPDTVVQLDKLDLAGENLIPADAPADWMTSLGLSSSDFETELDDELPDWLIAASEQIQQETPAELPGEGESIETENLLADTAADIDSIEWLGETEEATPTLADDSLIEERSQADQEEDIPDWMLEAGWQEKTTDIGESPTELEDELAFGVDRVTEESEAVLEADIPDWLRDLAPDDMPVEEAESDQLDAEDVDLAALFDERSDDEDDGIGLPGAALAAAGLAAAEGLFDREDEEVDEVDLDQVEETQPEDLPDAPENFGAPTETESDLPDWLQEFDPESETGLQEASEQPPVEADIPAWLAAIELGDVEEDEAAVADHTPEFQVDDFKGYTDVPADQVSIQSESEAPDWLHEFDEETLTNEARELDTDQAEIESSVAELPDWLQEIESTPPETESAVDVEITDAIETSESAATQIELEEPPDFTDADDALAWLAGLAAGQEIAEEIHPPTTEDESIDAQVADTPEQPEADSAGITEETYLEKDLWASTEKTDEVQEIELETPPDFEDMDAAVAWLEQLADGAPESSEVVYDTAEIPEQVEDEKSEPEEIAIPESPEMVGAQDEAPSQDHQKIDLNQASLIEIERQPGVGFQIAQLIVAFRESHGPFQSMDDVAEIPGIDPDDLFALHENFTVIAGAGSSPPAGTTEPDPSQTLVLREARQAASQGRLDEAVKEYSRLVSDGSNLDEVIFDLNQMLQTRPENIELWQLVGDAYMRNNQLIEAMQAYNKAEDLLH
jgi:competence ComEA-like helix-hairpin-helix protein